MTCYKGGIWPLTRLFPPGVLHVLLEGKKTNNGSDDKNHEGRLAIYCFQPPSKILPAGSIKQNHEIGPGVCGYARRGGFEVDAEIRAR